MVDVVYHVDHNDKLVFINDEWSRFARDNEGEAFLPERVLYKPLFDFITDASTRQLYSRALTRSREGREMRFPFRCDSPDRRRQLEMHIKPLENHHVQFCVREIWIQERAHQGILQKDVRRSGDIILMCGWCKRISLGHAWEEIEKAVGPSHLFDREGFPTITHGICPDCYQTVMRELDRK
jgi:hypothetical protein